MPGATAAALSDVWQETWWGEPAQLVLDHFGVRARVLPRPLDFGDSWVQIILPDVRVGGVSLIAFFQFDKQTGGLKRVQLERQRHGVNRAAFRAVIGGLEAAFGAPNAACALAPGPTNGYQAASEFDWSRDGNLIRAIFRDITIEAFEGCLTGDLTAGPCGLTGQLLVRIGPPAADRPSCRVLARPR